MQTKEMPLILDVCKNSLITQLAQLNNTINVLSHSREYTKILSLLLTVPNCNHQYTKRILFTGVGKNANLATKISETFASLGIPSMYLNSSHSMHGDSGFIGHNDILIHISRSGTTSELLCAAEHIRQIRPDVYQFLIHCNPNKKDVPELFDIELCVVDETFKEADMNNLAPTSSTTVLLATLDSLAIGLSYNNDFTREDFLQFHPGGTIGRTLKNMEKS